MNKRTVKTDTGKCNSDDSLYELGMQWLISEVDQALCEEGYVYSVSSLHQMFCKWLADNGVENLEKVAGNTRRLSEYFQNHYGEKMKILSQVGCSNLLCSSDLDISLVLREVKKLKDQLQDVECLNVGLSSSVNKCNLNYQTAEAYHIAKSIRKSVKSYNLEERRKCRESLACLDPGAQIKSDMDILYECAERVVPKELYNILAWIVSAAGEELGPDGRVILPKKQHEKVLNLAQDIAAATANVRTPKHIGIALHLLKKSRSKDSVTLLNRFGHCISYTDAQRYISTLSDETDTQMDTQGYFIPHDVCKGRFTQFAIDNLDFHENTVDGKTTHGTTHIIFQYTKDDAQAESAERQCFPIRKSRITSSKELEPVEPRSSGINLIDRQRSRSLKGIKLMPSVNEQLEKEYETLCFKNHH